MKLFPRRPAASARMAEPTLMPHQAQAQAASQSEAPRSSWMRRLKSKLRGTRQGKAETATLNSVATSVPAGQGAQIELAQNATGQVLAFGLKWRSIVVAGGATTALRIAREGKADVYAFNAAQHDLGTGFLRNERSSKASKNQLELAAKAGAAALTVARWHEGPCIYVLSLSAGSVWVLMSEDSHPRRDVVFKGPEAATAAQALVRTLFEQIPNARIFGDTQIAGLTAISVEPCAIADVFALPRDSADLVKALPKQAFGAGMPKFALPGIAVLLVALLAKSQYDDWVLREQMAQRAALAAQRAVQEDPVEAWKAALTQSTKNLEGPNAQALQSLRESLDSLPMVWLGWSLQGARCELQGPKGWSCVASYESKPGEKVANNAELARNVPKGFTATFKPVTKAELAWSIQVASGAAFEPAKLLERKAHSVQTAAELQDLMSVMTDAPTFNFVALKVTPPRKQDGSAIPAPAGVTIPSVATVNLKGSLNLIDRLIASSAMPVTWRAFSLKSESSGAPASDKAGTGLLAKLTVDLQGDLYAKD